MRVLNFGSLNIDHVYLVDHFVQPGETISCENLNYYLGGKGLNQSVALAKAGAEVFHAGKIGTDGAILRETLDQYGVKTEYLGESSGVNGHALIQVNKSGQNCIIIFGGSNLTITEDYIDSVLEHFQSDDLVLIQNETSCISYIAQQCSKKGIKVAFNPSPISQKLLSSFPFELISLFIINEVEGREMTGYDNPEEILNCLITKYPSAACILTLGKNGVIYKDKNYTYSHGTYHVPVVDTTAAGDTFTGYFLGCFAGGYDIPTCLEKASIASSLAVSKRGASASIPLMEEVDANEGALQYFPLY